MQQGDEAAAALKEAQDERDWARHDLGDAMASLQSLQVLLTHSYHSEPIQWVCMEHHQETKRISLIGFSGICHS